MKQQISFKLSGLTCQACQTLTQRRIQRIPGVQEVSVELATGVATVSVDRDVTRTEVQNALAGTHYTVEE